MSGQIGELDGEELWLRCPYCGDSESNPYKAHFSINIRKLVYHCHKCDAGGRLTTKEAFSLISVLPEGMDLFESDAVLGTAEDELPDLEVGAGSRRESCLQRWHLVDNKVGVWDSFLMRDPRNGIISGQHHRCGQKRMSIGDWGLGWWGDELTSTFNDPLFLVEGPYDVIGTRFVSCFGILSPRKLRALKGHIVNLVPDGDIWERPDLFDRFSEMVIRHTHFGGDPVIRFIYYIPDGKDPDEADRDTWEQKTVREFLHSLRRRKNPCDIS